MQTLVGQLAVIHPIPLVTIVKTTDGGTNWIEQSIATTNYLRAVFFISETTGWVSGNEGTLFKTTDGGTNWEPQNSDTTEGLYSIRFVDMNTGWIAGGSGLILHTTDSGSNWTLQTTGTNQYLYSISFPDANNGWVVGSGGTILHTSNGGVTFLEEEAGEFPTDFSLLQNYPNPFNPSTKISWQSPVGSWQTLKVYDVLGNEVATLVNEEKPAGKYEVEFNSHSGSVRNLTSGIYFYKLQAGNFVQTKKMILLK